MDDRDFDAVDYFRSDRFVADPYPYYDHLRAQCPIHQESHHDVFMVTGYDEAVEVFTDHPTFSSCNAVSGPFAPFPVPLEGDDVSTIIEAHRDALPMSQEIMTMDPPRHTAIRSLAMRHFTPKRLAETEPFMIDVAHRLIDEFVADGRCELMHQFTRRFAVLNICELLGVPQSDHQQFLDALLGVHRDRGLGSVAAPPPDNPFGFLHEAFTTYVQDRRARPRDDVLTALATTPFPDGSTPELMDVVRLSSTFFGAGSGTTAHFLGSALRFIGEQPDLQQRLRDEPARIPNYVEEALRLESPVKATFRLARVATVVGGVEIPAGSTVMIVDSGSNRDPRRFDRPNELRLDRENSRQHLAFGFGIHLCAGAALARAEGRIGIGCLLDRLHAIEVSEAAHGPVGDRRYQYLPTYQLRGLEQLHLEFQPAAVT